MKTPNTTSNPALSVRGWRLSNASWIRVAGTGKWSGISGACAGCPATIMTVITSLESELRKLVPEVEVIEAVP